ncbi:MAG: hypothetical protein NTY02_06170, partial [Acidobacteria bacterium]|nr:hypothetical protein [Acidobacteriota bacterium]
NTKAMKAAIKADPELAAAFASNGKQMTSAQMQTEQALRIAAWNQDNGKRMRALGTTNPRKLPPVKTASGSR